MIPKYNVVNGPMAIDDPTEVSVVFSVGGYNDYEVSVPISRFIATSREEGVMNEIVHVAYAEYLRGPLGRFSPAEVVLYMRT